MATANQVQQFVHRLEEGGWVKWIQLGALIAVCVTAYIFFIFDPSSSGYFRGLSTAKGMEQAGIARELARGNGFTTKMIRPAVLGQMKDNLGTISADALPDTYHAPLWPVVLAPFFRIAKSSWQMSTKDQIYVLDRIVAAIAAGLFLLSAVVSYFNIRRIFDHQLAILSVGLMLLCEVFWQFAQSGLPQSLLLLLFSLTIYTLIRAVENAEAEKPVLGWLIGAAALFGLLALAHGLTIWIFVGAVAFCGFYFKPRYQVVLGMLAVFLLIYSPWMVRNYKVCGNPLGSGCYSVLTQVQGTEYSIMRDSDFHIDGISPSVFRYKIQCGIASQFSDIYTWLGQILVAPVFFLALLHLFKNRCASHFRWLLLCMWLAAVFGMALFGFDEDSYVGANNLHVLFIPLFTAYGLAFVLVLWTRLEINISLIQKAFITLIYGISALPMVNTLTATGKSFVNWPPYVPLGIAMLNGWTTEQEIIASDMPWAVAWYADRKSLWLPLTLQDFIDLNDYGRLSGKIVGLYLTPVTGNRALIGDIVKGEYKEWSPFILRSVNAKDFPLRAATALPVDGQCIFYADHDRWSDRQD